MFKNTNFSKRKTKKGRYDKSNKADVLDSFLINNKTGKLSKNNQKVFFKSSGSVKIGYTKKSRTFYLNNKEVFEEIHRLCSVKNQASKPINLILKDGSQVNITKLSSNSKGIVNKGLSHTNSFVVKVNDKIDIHRYFVKEINSSVVDAFVQGREGFREAIAQNIIKELGFNTIPVHFCFCNAKHKQSFIVYDYSKFSNLAEVLERNNGKFKYKDQMFTTLDFENLCINAQKEINSKLHLFKDKYSLKETDQIIDIRPENLFVDKKKGKLYIFDSWLNSDPTNYIK